MTIEKENNQLSVEQVVADYASGLIKKWSRTGLLEGLDEIAQGKIAILLENSVRDMVARSNKNLPDAIKNIVQPLVRRVYGELASDSNFQVTYMPTSFYIHENGAKEPVVMRTRSLACSLTEDFEIDLYGQQDLTSYHHVQLEKELEILSILSDEISRDISKLREVNSKIMVYIPIMVSDIITQITEIDGVEYTKKSRKLMIRYAQPSSSYALDTTK